MWKDWYRIGMVSAVTVAVVVVGLYVILSRGPAADSTPLREPLVSGTGVKQTVGDTPNTTGIPDGTSAVVSTSTSGVTPPGGATTVSTVADIGTGLTPPRSTTITGVTPGTPGTPGTPDTSTITRTGQSTETTATVDAPVTRNYSVRSGDTFASIARRELGGEQHWFEIAQANPLVDPAKLRIGQSLRIPEAGSISKSTRVQPVEVDGQVLYVVRPGDTLTSIARQYYTSETHWKTIFDANREKIGSDASRLEAGTQLVIPSSPKRAERR